MFFELERFQRVQEQNLQKLVGCTMSIEPEWQDAKMPVTHWPVSPRSRSQTTAAMAYDQSMQMWRLSLSGNLWKTFLIVACPHWVDFGCKCVTAISAPQFIFRSVVCVPWQRHETCQIWLKESQPFWWSQVPWRLVGRSLCRLRLKWISNQKVLHWLVKYMVSVSICFKWWVSFQGFYANICHTFLYHAQQDFATQGVEHEARWPRQTWMASQSRSIA